MRGAAADRCSTSFCSLVLLLLLSRAIIIPLLLVIVIASTTAHAKVAASFKETTESSSTRSYRHAIVYRADIIEIPNTNSGVTGFTYIFASRESTSTSTGTIGYAGQVSGLQPNLLASTCTAVNGCGVHVHAGFSCQNTESQGGHYYVNTTTIVNGDDPWIDIRYSSNSQGQTKFSGIVNIGNTDELGGRAFIIHAEDGSRLGCGLLRRVEGFKLLRAMPKELTDSGVAATVTAHVVHDEICFFVAAQGLEPNINSYLNSDDGTEDCMATNGCGLHVHSGNSCQNTEKQGGHYWNADTFPVDPWLNVGYLFTDSNGNTHHADCVTTGEMDYVNYAFLIHANNGSRVACDVLSKAGTDYCDYYCKRNDNQGKEWCQDCYAYV